MTLVRRSADCRKLFTVAADESQELLRGGLIFLIIPRDVLNKF